MQSAEIIIIGGGLIGLATGYQLVQQGRQVVLLEKEADVGARLSNRSGIVHSAIHVRPHTSAAHHIRYGSGMLHTFCQQESIAPRHGDQLFVASDASDLPNLGHLKRQGMMNGVRMETVAAADIPAIEPFASGIAGLLVRDVPIVDFRPIVQRLALRFEMRGGELRTREKVIGLTTRADGVIVKSNRETYIAQHVVNAAGVDAERLAQLAGHASPLTFVPFRGEYMRLATEAAALCQHLIFPIPNPDLPFLGIHLARHGVGATLCGPNAVLAGGRRQRRKGQLSLRTSLGNLLSPPVRKLSLRYYQTALWEQRRSWSKRLFALTLQRLVPAVETHLLTSSAAGTQTYAITEDGEFVHDFVIDSAENVTHILSVPNFGASACLSIGQTIANALSKLD